MLPKCNCIQADFSPIGGKRKTQGKTGIVKGTQIEVIKLKTTQITIEYLQGY